MTFSLSVREFQKHRESFGNVLWNVSNNVFFLPRVRSYDRSSIFVHLIWRFLPAFQRFSHQRISYIDISMVSSGERVVLIRNPILFDVNRDVDLIHVFCNHSCELWVVLCNELLPHCLPYKNNKLLCTVLISSAWKLCKFKFYTIDFFFIHSIFLNQIFLMECFESIVAFIIDGGSKVEINMASINVKKLEFGKLNKRCLT